METEAGAEGAESMYTDYVSTRTPRAPRPHLAGRTTDGRAVVGGLFSMYDTYGVPLEALLDALRARGLVMDWAAFYRDARSAGWTHEAVVTRVEEAVGDVCGAEAREHVMRALQGLTQ